LLRAIAVAVAAGVLTAAAVSYAPVPRLLLVVLPIGFGIACLVFSSPVLAAALLGASLPELQDVTGGHLGLHIAASDVLLVLVVARCLADVFEARPRPVLSAVRPVRLVFAQYGWLILLLLALHPGFSSVAKSAQRIELFAFPLLAGAYLALRRDHMLVLKAYVLAATLLAAVWPLLNSHGLAGQFDKNPTGELIVGAILLLVSVRGLRRLLPCLPILVVGLALTASRGAVLALVVGVAVLTLWLGARSRRVLLARTLMVVLTAALVYQWLPSSITTRFATLSSGTGTTAAYAIYIRGEYAQDAEHIIAAHPWTGIGVGNYIAGDASLGTSTTDPHDVILLEAAEGGYVFAASFILLIVGSAFALWRIRRVELAPVAAAVLLATAAHGLVDVYWVRGTPDLGFLLVGMVCGLAVQRRPELAA
jgi:hypothetical protein